MSDAPLSAADTIETWLAHPVGGPLIREMLAASGSDEQSLAPVASLPLQQLVVLSQGKMPQSVVDDLVVRAGGDPNAAPPEAAPAPATAEWTERVTPGRFAGKTVIVTGAGSGIGRATASRIVREGGAIVAVDVSAERLDDLVAAHAGAPITAIVADITDQQAVDRIVESAGPRIDGLANVAGIMDDMTPVGDVSDDVWRRVFAVNVEGTMRLARAVVDRMAEQGAGSIVNVTSEAGLRGSAAGAAYTASKHAVVGLTKSTAFMYGPSGVRTNAVAPGGVVTNIEATFASELGKQRVFGAMGNMPSPVAAEQLAASITFLLSDDGVNINGAILPSDGGWSAV